MVAPGPPILCLRFRWSILKLLSWVFKTILTLLKENADNAENAKYWEKRNSLYKCTINVFCYLNYIRCNRRKITSDNKTNWQKFAITFIIKWVLTCIQIAFNLLINRSPRSETLAMVSYKIFDFVRLWCSEARGRKRKYNWAS